MGKQDNVWTDRGAFSRRAIFLREMWRPNVRRARSHHLTRFPDPFPPPIAVRFGDLPKEERKAVNKVVNRQVMKGFDHTHICNKEIGGMLACFESHNWETAPCLPQIEAMYACVETHKDDPDPKVLVGKWQKQMKRSVLQHFTRVKVAARK